MQDFEICIKGPIKKVNDLANFIGSLTDINKKTIQKKDDCYESFFIINRKEFFKNYEDILSFALKINFDMKKLDDNFIEFGENTDHKIIEIKEKDPFGNDSIFKI